MKPEIITLCEYASEHNGQLTIVNTFDALAAAKFPWRAYFHVAAKINITDCTKHYETVKMYIVSNNSGAIIFEASSPFTKERIDKFNVVAGLKGLIFDQPGEYLLKLSLDNDMIVEYPFKVVEKKDE